VRRPEALGLAVALSLGLAVLVAIPAMPADPVREEAVTAIARELRCVVCQNLSVADSPSETARQMRDVIRERLAAGSTPEEVRAYFVDKYGEWVLLAPPARGFGLVVWILPFAALAVGGLLVGRALRRWTRQPPGAGATPGAPPPLDPSDRARLRAALDELRD
jgi:cytochrome c-type biogenesis protein CcmH